MDAMGNPDTCTLIYNPSIIEQRTTSEPLVWYPNPCRNKITIQTKPEAVGSPFQIFDLHGRTLMRGILNDTNTEIAPDHLASGVYMIRCDADHEQVHQIVRSAN